MKFSIKDFFRIPLHLLKKFLRENFIFYAVKLVLFTQGLPEAYSEPCETSQIELFTKLVNGCQSLIIMAIKARSKMFVRILNTPLTYSPKISNTSLQDELLRVAQYIYCLKNVKKYTEKYLQLTLCTEKRNFIQQFFFKLFKNFSKRYTKEELTLFLHRTLTGSQGLLCIYIRHSIQKLNN